MGLVWIIMAAALLLPKPASAATLVYSNDVLGELEPCGCRSGPLGGVVRRANLLARIEDRSLLQLDGGDLLFPTTPVPPALAAQSEKQAEFLLRSLQLMGQDAVVPGEKDFGLGVAVFQRLLKKTSIRFLAANLVRRKDGAPLLPSHEIFTRSSRDGKRLRIAVIGLVGPQLAWPKDLRVTSPMEAARRLVPGLRRKVDRVIALTHQGFDEDQKLARAVPGIDLIVGAHSQSFLQQPPVEKATRIFQSSFRNQHVGLVSLDPQAPGAGDSHRLVALDPGYDDSPGAATPMGNLVRDFKAEVARINLAESARLAPAQESERSGQPKFQTFPRCAECHLKQYDFWRKTRHASALAPLIEKAQARNKQCLACHTVGLDDAHGFSAVDRLADRRVPGGEGTEALTLEELHAFLKAQADAPGLSSPVAIPRQAHTLPLKKALGTLERSWTPVQCENCHGPGHNHPFSGQIARSVEHSTCLKCHTPDTAPQWYKAGQPDPEAIAKKHQAVACPAGSLGDEDL